MLKTNKSAKGNSYFIAIANAVGDIIHFSNANKPICDPSPATEFLLGYNPGKLSGQLTMEIIHPEDRDTVLNAMESTSSGSAIHDCEIRMLKNDNTFITAQMTTFYFKIEDHSCAGAVLRDISSKKIMEKNLENHCNLMINSEISGPTPPEKFIKKEHSPLIIIPTCMYCDKIRNKSGAWVPPLIHLQTTTGAYLSHGICPKCAKMLSLDFGAVKKPADDND